MAAIGGVNNVPAFTAFVKRPNKHKYRIGVPTGLKCSNVNVSFQRLCPIQRLLQIHSPRTRTMSMSPPPSIRAANRQQKRSKYIRTCVVVCMTCRAKRIRCDATKPNCLQCTDGQRECIWPESVPKREQLVIIPERPIPPSFLVLLFASVFTRLTPIPRSANPAVMSSILEYPPFNDVIHWEGVKRVVLEQPQILESYILMPVFGLRTLDAFKRKLYVRPYD